ncbi:MAG: hypothetical protein P4L85_09995 [Paludisphaera borealis]|uniref:hypothetical protein n=1 Tax=Paludisphaera borealis TaxID=1387353 RepID=UPI00283BE239|nr:hypothetical protein [Paludisphaera borealis]MDR3619671.1 hypothetical protein [Paludisphaera borealis]
MALAKRAIPRVLGQVVLAATSVNNAVIDMMRDVEDVAPAIFPANLPEPQLQLVNTIALLFAGSLSILVCGYVFESDNFTARESPQPSHARVPRRR